MKRYLNHVHGGWWVGKRPTKHTLGAADIPKLNLEHNQTIALIDHFVSIGLLYWDYEYDEWTGKKSDYESELRLTDAGWNVMFRH